MAGPQTLGDRILCAAASWEAARAEGGVAVGVEVWDDLRALAGRADAAERLARAVDAAALAGGLAREEWAERCRTGRMAGGAVMTRDEVLAIVAEAREGGVVANLSHADLGGVDLSGADLGGVDLSHADLRVADLRGSDLRFADLRYANLGFARLGGADLRGANLGRANLSHAVLPDGWTIRQWSGCGSSRRITTLAVYSGGHTVWCGCLTGTVDEFAAAVEATHAAAPVHLEDYRAIVADMRRILAREGGAA